MFPCFDMVLHQKSIEKLNYHQKRLAYTDWLYLATLAWNLLPSFGWNVLSCFDFPFAIWYVFPL